jgi:integrase
VLSIAKVDMPKWYMDELKVYQQEWNINKENAGDKWLGGIKQYIFHAGFGKPLYFTYPSKWWEKFTKRHNLKYITFHGLRHSTATILLENNTDIKTIQERLRHASYKTTADLYMHATQKVSRSTAEKFDKFNPKRIEISLSSHIK